jgi:DNA-binding transcriptional regulator YiaG
MPLDGSPSIGCMSQAEIDARDKLAEKVKAREMLRDGVWPTAELIAAADYPEGYFDSEETCGDYEPGEYDDCICCLPDCDYCARMWNTVEELETVSPDTDDMARNRKFANDVPDGNAIFLPSDFVAWRERMGWTQREAAEALKVTERQIRRWEAGSYLAADGSHKDSEIPYTVALACWALTLKHSR